MPRLAASGLFLLLSACAGPAVSSAGSGLSLYFIDIEGGAATLIVTPAGESILVDSGMPGERDPGRIVRVAKEQAGLSQIDHHVITHWDIDHYGGTEPIGREMPIRSYYDHGPSVMKNDARYEKAYAVYQQIPPDRRRVLAPGDTIPLRSVPGGLPVEVRVVAAGGKVLGDNPPACAVHAMKPENMNDNASSIAFVLTFGAFRFYDGADLLWNFEHRLACPKLVVGPVDVYQVTHHGLPVSNHPALVNALNPRVAIMNNGDRKGCDPAVLETLRQCPGLQALFQLHLNLKVPPEAQAPPARIANREPEKTCPGQSIVLRVAPDSRSYTVTVGSAGTPERVSTR
jgi:competence protein ComEC